MGRLSGKNALITGSGSGIGRTTAKLFAEEGARVAVVDLNGESADQTTTQILESGGDSIAVCGDVSTHDEASSVVGSVLQSLGRIDILVNNAGVPLEKPLLDLVEDDLGPSLAVNIKAPLFMSKHVIASMVKSGHGGSIVNIASMAAIRARPAMPVYVTTKGAVTSLTRALAIDFASYGIRANCVCPAATETPMLKKRIAAMPEGATEYRKRNSESIPLKRLAEPIEMAQTVLFLASDESSYITGHVVPVDGGSTAGTLIF